jgi:L-ectoine synthase
MKVPQAPDPSNWKGKVAAMKPNYLKVAMEGNGSPSFFADGTDYYMVGMGRSAKMPLEKKPTELQGVWEGEIDAFFGGEKLVEKVTTMYAGKELKMHYQNHLEAVLVLKGKGTIEDLGTGETHQLAAGTMSALNAHDRHIVRPETDILTVCVFNPPVTGREVHDENGAYPAEADMVRTAELTS